MEECKKSEINQYFEPEIITEDSDDFSHIQRHIHGDLRLSTVNSPLPIKQLQYRFEM
jgi:hypothetical protein